MTATPARSLYLIAYDIADHRRLAQVHRFLLGYKVGGQKSFYECWLTAAERQFVLGELAGLINPEEDRVHLFQLDPRMTPKCFGVARPVQSTTFTIV